MEEKNLDLDLNSDEMAQLRSVLRKMGDFIALFEIAEAKMASWKEEINESLQANERLIKLQLQDISNAAAELKEIITETGAARWRVAAEQALAQGEAHVAALQASIEAFQAKTDSTFERLDRASNFVVKNICEATASFDFDEFKKMTSKTGAHIESVATRSIRRVKQVLSWLYWKSMLIAVAVGLLVTFGVCFYLNDQFPWELHQQVKIERAAGRALLQAWPDISDTERQRIRKFYQT